MWGRANELLYHVGSAENQDFGYERKEIQVTDERT